MTNLNAETLRAIADTARNDLDKTLEEKKIRDILVHEEAAKAALPGALEKLKEEARLGHYQGIVLVAPGVGRYLARELQNRKLRCKVCLKDEMYGDQDRISVYW